MKILRLLSLLFLTLSLAACGKAESTPLAPPAATAAEDQPVASAEATARWDESTQSDSQGEVIVEITPLNLNNPGETLEFAVSLNTHSVDLSMDLAERATLTTDMGYTVQALKWDAPRGGHHVSGTLIFPATLDGKPLLEGANGLTLSIKSVDASLRLFSWIRSR
ncbi:MAG: hypothetical protein Fur0043_20870 [Anaerolineales bacterium]